MNNVNTESKIGGSMQPLVGTYSPTEITNWVDGVFGTLANRKITPKQSASYKAVSAAFGKAFKAAAEQVPGGLFVGGLQPHLEAIADLIEYSLTKGCRSNA